MTRENRVPLSGREIRSLYDSLSHIYGLLTRFEKDSLKKALDIASVREHFVVLEAGFGTGKTLVEFAKKIGKTGEVYGLDISRKMTDRSQQALRRRNLSSRVSLVLGDMEYAPFSDGIFDLVFSSYTLDLIDTATIPKVLSEFKRLLKPTGRIVLVGLSEGSKWYDSMTLYGWVYRRLPSLLGGCRPVLLTPYLQDLKFEGIGREFMRAGHLMPTEIVWASKGK